MKWLGKYWFIIGILVALVAGIVFPPAGTLLNPKSVTTDTLVILLFLISGFTLPSESILHGLKNYKLHLYIQGFIFVVSPIVLIAGARLFFGAADSSFQVGVVGLAVLPTTISSCIIFTQLSGGNAVGTMFNASVANIAGIFVSPFLLSLLLRSSHMALPPEQVISTLESLALKMLLPIVVGQLLRLVAKSVAVRAKKALGVVSNTFILLIIFLTLAKTAQNPAFVRNLSSMLVPFGYLAVAHIALIALSYGIGYALRFDRADLISIAYAAPQKTLALGVPLLSAYFASRPEVLGYALLPLLFYHPWQLVVAGALKNFSFMKPKDMKPTDRITKRPESG